MAKSASVDDQLHWSLSWHPLARRLPLPLGLEAKDESALLQGETNKLLLQLPDRRINMRIDRFPIGMRALLKLEEIKPTIKTNADWLTARGRAKGKGKSQWRKESPSTKQKKRKVHMCNQRHSWSWLVAGGIIDWTWAIFDRRVSAKTTESGKVHQHYRHHQQCQWSLLMI